MRLEYANRNTPENARRLSTSRWIVIIVIGWGCFQILPRLFDGRDYLEVDIRSGRTRHVHHFLYWDVHEQVQATAMSRALMQPAVPWSTPDWQVMFTFYDDDTVTRDDWVYGLANYQLSDLSDMWHEYPFTAAAERAVARNVLTMWNNHDVFPATDYINAVSKVAEAIAQDSPRAIDISDLPAVKRPIR